MNDDETQVVPDNESQEAQPDSGQTTEAVVTPEPTAPALSLKDVEALMEARERKLRAEFEERERKNQSKSDKAYAAALAKAKVIEENAEVLGLDAEQVKTAKQAVIDKEFSTAFNNAPSEQPTQPQNDSISPTVSDAEIRAELAKSGIVNEELVEKYKGKNRLNDSEWADWDKDVTLAKAEMYRQREIQKANQQKAAQAAQVKANVGRVNPVPAGGAPSLGYDPVQELEKMNAENPPNDRAAYMTWKAKYDRLTKEAGWA